MNKEEMLEFLIGKLSRKGVRISRGPLKEADASRVQCGIKTLGRLEGLKKYHGFVVFLPEIEYSPRKGYRGLRRP